MANMKVNVNAVWNGGVKSTLKLNTLMQASLSDYMSKNLYA